MWKTVHNNFHIVNIRMKSCSLKKSTLFISISKVVHLRFPLYQHPHTKLFFKNFHIIDIHRKSCSLKTFHFIKTHKQFFLFPLYQYPPKSYCNNFGPFVTSQVLPDIVVDLDLPNENVIVFLSSYVILRNCGFWIRCARGDGGRGLPLTLHRKIGFQRGKGVREGLWCSRK